jgi:putative methionine-R-sulfoxide reductase with GAF domain
MLISQGVAGRCYRTRELCNIPIMDDFQKQHVRDLGFLPEEVQRFRQDRKSYVCVPMLSQSGDVLAILSFDSSEMDTFTRERVAQINGYVPLFQQKLTL